MARNIFQDGVQLPEILSLDLGLDAVPAALGALGHQGAGGGPPAGQGRGGAWQIITGPLSLSTPGRGVAGNFAHTLARTGGNRLSTPTPLPLQEFACRLRRGWSAASARAQPESAAASRSRGGAGLENPGAAAGRGRGRGRGRPPSCAARRARTWTPAAPAYTPGLRGLPREAQLVHPPPGTPRPAPPRPSQRRRRRRREEQNVLPGQEEHPPDHGEPRCPLPASPAPPAPCSGRGLASGPREDLPGPAPGPLPSASELPPAPASPCALSRRCHLLPSSFPRSRGAREHPQGAGSPETPSAPREGSGLGMGGGGETRFLKRRCASPPQPRGASLEAPLGVGGQRGPLLTRLVQPPASGAEMPFPRSPPLGRPLCRPRRTGSSLSQTKQLRPALSPSPGSPRSPWPPGALLGAGVWRPPAPGGSRESAPSSLSEHPGSSAPWRKPSNTTRPRLGKSDCPPRAARKQSRPSRQPGAQRREGEGEGEREGSAWGPRGQPAPGSPWIESQLCAWLQGRAWWGCQFTS